MTDFWHIDSKSRLSEALRCKDIVDFTPRSVCGVIEIQPLRCFKKSQI